MNCAAIENEQDCRSSTCVVVGFGNSIRSDDGLGHFVVAGLETIPGIGDRARLLTCHQLEPDIVEDLCEAELVILVDATASCVAGGREWSRIEPNFDGLPYVGHTLSPGQLLGLLKLLHKRQPVTWLVTVQGEDFGFGEVISAEAASRARLAIADIAEIVSKEE